MHDVSEAVIKTPVPALEGQCGLDKAAASALKGGAELMDNATHTLAQGWVAVRELLECKTFNPIYTTFVHDGKSQGHGLYMLCKQELCSFVLQLTFCYSFL